MSKTLRPLEADLQRAAIDLLTSYQIRVYRRNTGAIKASHNGKPRFIRFSEPGQSDLWLIFPDGRHGELEIKRPGERPTLAQVRWLIECSTRCPAWWIDNLSTLVRVVDSILRGSRIVYREDVRRYGKEGWGPSGDYDLREGP